MMGFGGRQMLYQRRIIIEDHLVQRTPMFGRHARACTDGRELAFKWGEQFRSRANLETITLDTAGCSSFLAGTEPFLET